MKGFVPSFSDGMAWVPMTKVGYVVFTHYVSSCWPPEIATEVFNNPGENFSELEGIRGRNEKNSDHKLLFHA